MRESMGRPHTPSESRLAWLPLTAHLLACHQPSPGQAGLRRGAGFPITVTHRRPDLVGYFLKKGPRQTDIFCKSKMNAVCIFVYMTCHFSLCLSRIPKSWDSMTNLLKQIEKTDIIILHMQRQQRVLPTVRPVRKALRKDIAENSEKSQAKCVGLGS